MRQFTAPTPTSRAPARSHPVAPATAIAIGYGLSLDAVAIVLAWAGAYAALVAAPAGPAAYAVLGAAVWLGYTADRWLDGRRRPRHAHHRLSRRHAGVILGCWIVVMPGATLLAHGSLSPAVLAAGWTLAALTLAYTILAQLRPPGFRAARTYVVGGLLAAAIGLFHPPASPEQLLALAQLGLLFALNCITIRRGERGPALRARPISPAFGMAAVLLAGGAIVGVPGAWSALVGAALALQGLVQSHGRAAGLGAGNLRVVADALLLAPAAIVVVLTYDATRFG